MIAIFSNSGEWGGVDVLTERFAKHLALRNVDFCIIEPEGGRIRQSLNSAWFVKADQLDSVAKRLKYVFVPSVSKFRHTNFPWQLLENANVFAWVVHPNDVFRRFFPYSSLSLNLLGYKAVKLLRLTLRSHSRLFDDLFSLLAKEKALAVMDGATCRSFRYFVPKCKSMPKIIPVPSPTIENFVNRHRIKGTLSIGYLGRMDSMKWSAIKPFIRHTLAPMAKKQKIVLHLVSEGSHLSRLERLCSKHRVDCLSHGYLPNQQARELIYSSTDLAIAMGTSALDIAGGGHPCIIIDPSLGIMAPKQKYFRFVHETSDYTVGEYRDFPGYVKSRGVFEEMVVSKTLYAVALAGKSYVQQSHDPEKCFDELLKGIESSTLTIGCLEKYVKRVESSFNTVKRYPFLTTFTIK